MYVGICGCYQDATKYPVSNPPNAVARMDNGNSSSIGCRPTESAAMLKDYAQSERGIVFEVVRNVVVFPTLHVGVAVHFLGVDVELDDR